MLNLKEYGIENIDKNIDRDIFDTVERRDEVTNNTKEDNCHSL